MQTINKPTKILFVYLAPSRISKSEMEHDITQLWQLVETLGNAVVVDLITQKGEVTPATYIGSGKVEELYTYVETHPIDTIIINGQLTPRQKFFLIKMFWPLQKNIQVWDRIDLILAIFDNHAKTTEAKLQINLARATHMGPRIFGMGLELSRQGGGIGGRGLGETNTELMHRHWKREIKKITDQLAAVKKNRLIQIEHRKNIGIKTISLVGYTNAGKTSLFNALTHKKHLVEDELFATLDSTVGEVYIPTLGSKVVISDTIGFIEHLPPHVIDAFTSTLLESIHADIVLHVVDASDTDAREKIFVVADILNSLKIHEKKEILVFTKSDKITEEQKNTLEHFAKNAPHIFVSAKTQVGFEELFELINKFFI